MILTQSPPRVSVNETIPTSRPKITNLELFLALIFSVLLGLIFFACTGGPLRWNDLSYLEIALNPTKNVDILNRYYHIYFQKLFINLSGHALIGARLYWAFSASATVLMTYVISRLLTTNPNRSLGFLAVAFLLVQPLLFEMAGAPFADFTVMLAMMFGALIYLLTLDSYGFKRSCLLLLFGVTLYFAVKSKETGVCLLILIPALLIQGGSGNRTENVLKAAFLIMIGVLSGVVVLVCLDGIYLKDPFFSLNPANYAAHGDAIFFQDIGRMRGGNWIKYISSTPVLLPFLFYLINVVQGSGDRSMIKKRWVLLIPIVWLLCLIALMGRANFGRTIMRYIIPVLPLLCVGASQFFDSQNLQKKLSLRVIPVAVLTGIAAAIAILKLGKVWGWNPEQFFFDFLMPGGLLLTCLLAGTLKAKPRSWEFMSIMTLAMLFYFPASENIQDLIKKKPKRMSEKRFEWISEFAENIQLNDKVLIFVEPELMRFPDKLVSKRLRIKEMLNVYFNGHLKEDQIIFDDEVKRILEKPPAYAFLSSNGWNRLVDSASEEDVRMVFSVKRSSGNRSWFLSQKTNLGY